ncbi:MAG: hypothetical protein EOP02_24775, partial [Proteobacteria bacterium]
MAGGVQPRIKRRPALMLGQRAEFIRQVFKRFLSVGVRTLAGGCQRSGKSDIALATDWRRAASPCVVGRSRL